MREQQKREPAASHQDIHPPIFASSSVEFAPGQPPFIRFGVDAPASRMTLKELLLLEQEVLAQEDLMRAGIIS